MAMKPVPVHPATLRWAREVIGLSAEQVAEKLKVPTEQIDAWEDGEPIGLAKAKKLALRYKVPLPVLYLKVIPEEWRQEKPKDFRRLESRRPYSHQLCYAIRHALGRQSWFREYLQDENEKPLGWLGRFSDQLDVHPNKVDVNRIATYIVEWLEIDRQAIAALKGDKEALSYWIGKVEAKRVIVTSNQTYSAYKIDSAEYSGLVLYDRYAPLILLNPADSFSRRIFTLIHELAHLFLDKKSGVSQIDFRQNLAGYDPTEALCNRIAAEVLISDDSLKSQWNENESVRDTISKLQSILKVSHSAIAVRFKRLGFIDQEMLDSLLGENEQFYLAEKSKEKNKKSYGGSAQDKQVLDRCGELLTKSVLDAYEQGSIHATEIYDILGMKIKHLGALSKRLKYPLHRWIS